MEQSIVPTNSAVALTPPSLNVYEAAFLSEKEYAVSASEHGRPRKSTLPIQPYERATCAGRNSLSRAVGG